MESLKIFDLSRDLYTIVRTRLPFLVGPVQLLLAVFAFVIRVESRCGRCRGRGSPYGGILDGGYYILLFFVLGSDLRLRWWALGCAIEGSGWMRGNGRS